MEQHRELLMIALFLDQVYEFFEAGFLRSVQAHSDLERNGAVQRVHTV